MATDEQIQRARKLRDFNREQVRDAGGLEEAREAWVDSSQQVEDAAADADAIEAVCDEVERLRELFEADQRRMVEQDFEIAHLRERVEAAEEVLDQIDTQAEHRVDHERSQGEENCPHCIIRSLVARFRNTEGEQDG